MCHFHLNKYQQCLLVFDSQAALVNPDCHSLSCQPPFSINVKALNTHEAVSVHNTRKL